LRAVFFRLFPAQYFANAAGCFRLRAIVTFPFLREPRRVVRVLRGLIIQAFSVSNILLPQKQKAGTPLERDSSLSYSLTASVQWIIFLNETNTFFSYLKDIDFFFSCQAIDSEYGQHSRLVHINN
jgi:hypothetical protein